MIYSAQTLNVRKSIGCFLLLLQLFCAPPLTLTEQMLEFAETAERLKLLILVEDA